ncbi:hypothetical protein ABZ642_16165 [Streptomyces sp. NPDC007157]|uniref:DUF6959 family protein n=1 Tax=Streptomyces sp. NPDC007157 TaxID=3154681 RepID=UPI0033C551E8
MPNAVGSRLLAVRVLFDIRFRSSIERLSYGPRGPADKACVIAQGRLCPSSFMSAGDVGLDDPMERIEAELFTDGGNEAVVRLPGRRFPGVLVQGDSLHILRSDVAEVMEACERGELDEAPDSAGLLLTNLDALLSRYEAALSEHEIPRPY